MTKDERQELRQIQETLIVALAKITEMLGTPNPREHLPLGTRTTPKQRKGLSPHE
jgi:hypothetical protein